MQVNQPSLALIELIYQCAVEPGAWPRALSALSDWVGASKCILFTPFNSPLLDGFVFSHGMDEGDLEAWAAHHQVQDLWAARCLERGLHGDGCIVLDRDLLSESEFLESAWYRHFLRQQDIGRMAAISLFGLYGQVQPAIAISFFRSFAASPFDEQTRAQLRLIHPHLARVLVISTTMSRLEANSAIRDSALDQMAAGIALLDQQAAILYCNRAAQALLINGDVLRISSNEADARGGRLLCVDPTQQIAYAQAFQRISASDVDGAASAEALVLHLKGALQSLLIQLSLVQGQASLPPHCHERQVLVRLTDLGRPCVADANVLKVRFGLTSAEARVAEFLLAFDTQAALAEHLGLSVNTLKTQLKRVYEKLGVGSRAAFALLVKS